MNPSELVIVGTALAYPTHAETVLGDLAPADLGRAQYGAVLAAIRTLIETGAAPEPALVLAALERQHGIRPPAGRKWAVIVHDCLRMATVPEGSRPHRRAVLEARLRRETRIRAQVLAESTDGPLNHLNEVLRATVTDLGLLLARIAEQSTPTTPPIAVPTDRAVEHMRNRLTRRRAA